MDSSWISCGCLFAVALIVTLLMTPLARRFAIRLDAVDYPGARRINTHAVPRMGGIAIFCGLAAALVMQYFGTMLLGWPIAFSAAANLSIDYRLLALSFLAIFLTGLLDDKFHLKPLAKLAGQIAAALIAMASGLKLGIIANPFGSGFLELGWWDYPITLVYLVAFVNIINLIDGLDGLASGITCISSATLFIISVLAGHIDAAALSIALAGSTLGFLRCNFYPASIFLGDSGSLLLGFSLGTITLLSVSRVAGLTTMLLPIVMAGVPVIDTFSAIVRRARAHVSIAHADRGHIHHRLIEQGFDHPHAVLLMYGWTALLCAGTLVMDQVTLGWRMAIFAALLVISIVFAMKLRLFSPVLLHRENPETGEEEIVAEGEPGFEEASEEFEEHHLLP